jgi:hypothetical protein
MEVKLLQLDSVVRWRSLLSMKDVAESCKARRSVWDAELVYLASVDGGAKVPEISSPDQGTVHAVYVLNVARVRNDVVLRVVQQRPGTAIACALAPPYQSSPL